MPKRSLPTRKPDQMNCLMQTRVTENIAQLAKRQAADQGLSEAAYLRRLVMKDLGLLEEKGT